MYVYLRSYILRGKYYFERTKQDCLFLKSFTASLKTACGKDFIAYPGFAFLRPFVSTLWPATTQDSQTSSRNQTHTCRYANTLRPRWVIINNRRLARICEFLVYSNKLVGLYGRVPDSSCRKYWCAQKANAEGQTIYLAVLTRDLTLQQGCGLTTCLCHTQTVTVVWQFPVPGASFVTVPHY